ncbi:MAG: hypothetical protein IJY14_00110 [Acholeplasmatales bacterium]|nr:hypothetical protein [Acholeplasmatales bacterium]
MNKIKSLIFGLSLVLTLSSCGSDDTEKTSVSEPTPSVTPSATPTPTPTPLPTDETPSDTTPSLEPTPTPLPTDETPTIFLAGDSTVKTYNDNQYIGGWGQFFDLFLSDDIEVVNCAQGGRSSRSFINEGRLYDIDNSSYSYSFTQNNGNSIEDSINEGDYLFIQFGHNDDSTKIASSYTTIYDRMAPLGEPDSNGIYPVTAGTKVSTASLPSIYTGYASDAEEASALKEIAKYGSEYYSYDCGGTYKWYLKQYIDFAREKGATPVLVTPVARVKYSGNTIIGGPGLHGDNFAYVEAVRQLADEEDCLLVDLFSESKTMLETATSAYGNYLMALKPNDLTGEWPSGYDKAYGNAELGYTGIEATHYNKYGAYLQAAKVAETIINSDEVLENGERFNFQSNVLATPEKYIDPSNLISKTIVSNIEALFTDIDVINENRTYKNPADVVALIDALVAKGEVTNDNYLDMQLECEAIRVEYYGLNIDDRPAVTNIAELEAIEKAVEELIIANRPVPINTVILSADDWSSYQTISSSTTVGNFTIVGNSEKTVSIKSSASSFTYNNESYSTSYGISMGGSAKFGQYRYISYEATGKCSITIVAKSTGSDDRIINICNSSNNLVGSAAANSSLSITTVDIEEAGTYCLGSSNKGVYIYYIIVEYFE